MFPYGWPVKTVEGEPAWMDQSFRDLIRQHPRLGELRRYLPENGSGAAFAGQAEIDSLPSSYSFRGYGAVIYALVRVLQPRSAVEIGIYQGYSL